MKKVYELYVNFKYPGFMFSEESTKTIYSGVKAPALEKEIGAFLKNIKKHDKGSGGYTQWFGFYFSQNSKIIEDDKEFYGKAIDIPGIYYVGELYTLNELKLMAEKDHDKFGILYNNFKSNWPKDKAVKTRCGNFQPFTGKDKLVKL